MNTTTKKKKFSLLSILIGLAIIGVLIALLIPTYRTYKSRANYTKIVNVAAFYKQTVNHCFKRTHHHLEHCALGHHGIPHRVRRHDRRYIKSIDISKGVIVIIPKTHRGILEEDTLVYIPNIQNAELAWTAAGKSVEKGYAN